MQGDEKPRREREQMKVKVAIGALIVGSLVASPALAGDETDFFFTDTSYLHSGDSPLATTADDFWLHDFEDGASGGFFGFSIFGGALVVPSSTTDSVDGDDGAIDGSGLGGHAWKQAVAIDGVLITFSKADLGALPTQAGLVWTDGSTQGLATFEAWDSKGNSIGTFSEVVGGAGFLGQTDEDRFFGVSHIGGISAIKLHGPMQGMEVDHVQFGLLVPGPGALALLGLAGLAGRGRRRSA